MEESIRTLRKWIRESENIVFFGGAGVSTESGIPDFRSEDGLYHQKFDYPAEEMLSRTFFDSHTEEFFRFYRANTLPGLDTKPNAAHEVLAALEKAGKVKAVITQNIDGLHQAAGSEEVLEVHGSIRRNFCRKCHKFFPPEFFRDGEGVPTCDVCGGVIKPDVVLFEESLDQRTLELAVDYIRAADVLIVGGTSLVVYPAAGLLRYYRGDRLVLINRDATPYDSRADLVIHDSIGKVLTAATAQDD